MIITLYLDNNILNFKLPSTISGSYTFDFEENEGSLINVDGTTGRWLLYETSDVKVINQNNNFVPNIELVSNNFYVLMRDNKKYLIFVYDVNLINMLAYSYNDNSSLIISNDENANIRYICNMLGNKNLNVVFKNNKIILSNTNNLPIYINKIRNTKSESYLKYGDTLEVYGLRITFLKEIILINNLLDRIMINNTGANISPYKFPDDEKIEDIDVKNTDLYKPSDYYLKSPRLRRLIETKEMKISNPPSQSEDNEMPLLLVVGPMLTMSVSSAMMLTNTLVRIANGEATFASSWVQIVTSLVMMASTLLWPTITRNYNKRKKHEKEEKAKNTFIHYLNDKRAELEEESKNQKIILYENLLTIESCLDILQRRTINFWDKRIDQSDFLTVRLGVGNAKLDANISYNEEEFEIEYNYLKKEVDRLVEDYKYIPDTPIGYSLYKNIITDIMGESNISFLYANNIILQLLTYYSYEDLKIVLFTDEAGSKKWEYIKYLNHNFNNEKDLRFFASNNEEAKTVSEFLKYEIENRKNNKQDEYRPHYLIVIDGYNYRRCFDFINDIADEEESIGFSALIIENKMSKLPSKCNNFIMLDNNESTILQNSYEKQEQIKFKPEIYNIDMMALTKVLANIPVEMEGSLASLKDTITFMEMEKVGKIEQLNILMRWSMNDSTRSLRAEVGNDANGDLIYLDLHEKYHGPHGLIAGMTGSGKSEFIISYILSMAINYSPDDVSFILIDYKGGGLAGAFENPSLGICLPHLAGTITNLDKLEIDRALVSIDSEVKRRQELFNEARDALGESKIDIYKYQKFYHEGKISEPIPHLFIICDEFAELKAQQPDFMDNLISVARIGRSLGVHLILATQKPSGVVNDQIWSNTRFRVCLKVQSESDSKEMLKRPEAASLKQAGRFYLQVGYDEYFVLGQSAWSGANYYPSDKIIKEVDKSVNFINNYGANIKSIQASNNIRIKSEGEQLACIMNNIIDVAKKAGKKAKRLWLENIKPIILLNELEQKYNYQKDTKNIEVILGEYDAPEKQEQGAVIYNYLNDGNTLVYGNDGTEIEMLYNTLIYETSKNFTSEEVNFYIIDYGSESMRRYETLPHVGGIVYQGDDEKLTNLIKMIKEEITRRKNLFINFGSEYKNYIKNSSQKLPIINIIINNYGSLYNEHNEIYETLSELVKDSQRYGVVFWISGSTINEIYAKIANECQNTYAFKLKDISDYTSLFGKKPSTIPSDIIGRGALKHDIVHLFQVASITDDENKTNEYLTNYVLEKSRENTIKAKRIPHLPKIIRFNDVKDYLKSLKEIPIGISKSSLDIIRYDFTQNIGNIISSNKLPNTKNFVLSLLEMFSYFKGIFSTVIDSANMITEVKDKYSNYYNDNFDEITDSLIKTIENYKNSKSNISGIIFIQGFAKYLDKLNDKSKAEELINLLKSYEHITLIAVDSTSALKTLSYENYFKSFSLSEGIWIGKGLSDSLFKLSNIARDSTLDYKNNMGFVINESTYDLIKLIDFISPDSMEDNNEQ